MTNPDPALSRERLDQIRETLWPTRHTYCAEPLDIEDARYLLAAVDALQQQNRQLHTSLRDLIDAIPDTTLAADPPLEAWVSIAEQALLQSVPPPTAR